MDQNLTSWHDHPEGGIQSLETLTLEGREEEMGCNRPWVSEPPVSKAWREKKPVEKTGQTQSECGDQ